MQIAIVNLKTPSETENTFPQKQLFRFPSLLCDGCKTLFSDIIGEGWVWLMEVPNLVI